jgi:hypothetical protein
MAFRESEALGGDLGRLFHVPTAPAPNPGTAHTARIDAGLKWTGSASKQYAVPLRSHAGLSNEVATSALGTKQSADTSPRAFQLLTHSGQTN